MRKLIPLLFFTGFLILPAYANKKIEGEDFQKFRAVLRAGSILEDLKTGEKTQTKTNITVWVATKVSTDRDCFIYDRDNKPRYQTQIENVKDIEKDLTIFPSSPDNSLNIEKTFNQEYEFGIEHHAKIFTESYTGEFFNDYLETSSDSTIAATRLQWASYYKSELQVNPGLSMDYQQGNMQSEALLDDFNWTAFYFGPAIKYFFRPWGSVGLMLQKSLNFNSKSNNNQALFTSDKLAFSTDVYYMDFSFGVSFERQQMSVEKSDNAFNINNDFRNMSIFTFNFGYHFDQWL